MQSHRRCHAGRKAGIQVSEITSTEYDTRECFVNDPDGYELWISSPAI